MGSTGVLLTDPDDEHQRWLLYLAAFEDESCAGELLEIVALEPDENVALGIVLRMMESSSAAGREMWISRLPTVEGRQYADRRARELAVLENRDLASVLTDGVVDTWSDWVQRRLAMVSTEREVLGRLVEEGRTKRIRRTASERLRRIGGGGAS